jgi:SAM-dependent methyltransferase
MSTIAAATFYFPLVLKDMFGFERVDFTDMTRKGDPVSAVNLPHDWTPRTWLSINVNLEEERLPTPDSTYDLVLCLEVIEHLEKDPMAMLNEINRVLKESGLIYLTTPNATSARNVLKIHRGYASHFSMQYSHAVELVNITLSMIRLKFYRCLMVLDLKSKNYGRRIFSKIRCRRRWKFYAGRTDRSSTEGTISW